MKRHGPQPSPAATRVTSISPNRGERAVRKRYLDGVFGTAVVTSTVQIDDPTRPGKSSLSGILAYLNFDETRRPQTYLLVGLLFTVGILAKAIVATVPVVVLILIWWKRGRVDWRRDVRPLLPFAVVAVAAGLLTAWMERAFSGAEGEDFQLSIVDRFLIAGRAFWFYIGKLLVPIDLSLIYPRWRIDSSTWCQYLFPF